MDNQKNSKYHIFKDDDNKSKNNNNNKSNDFSNYNLNLELQDKNDKSTDFNVKQNLKKPSVINSAELNEIYQNNNIKIPQSREEFYSQIKEFSKKSIEEIQSSI